MTQPLASWALTYKHPFWVSLQRLLRRSVISATDRRSGLRFSCTPGAERMMPEVFHYKVYDVPTAPVRRGHRVVDVGASHGFVACRFASRGARVLAIEPDPESFSKLTDNVRHNRLADLVEAIPCAVAGTDGERLLYRSREYGGGLSTTVRPSSTGLEFEPRDVLPVKARSLASLLSDWTADRIRLLKLDCEGAELEILAGLPSALWMTIDSIALEVHTSAYALDDLVRLAIDHGFHVSKVQHLYPNLHLVSRSALLAWAGQEGAA